MTDAPERIWVAWPSVKGCGLAFNVEADNRTRYILATPEALAASPEVQALIREAEARGTERAADALPKAISDAATKWCGEKDRETFQSDIDYFRNNWRALPGLRDYVLREIAPEDAIAELEKLRAERRNIVSHATMGATDGDGLSLNDVCVQITDLRNQLYRDAQADRDRLAADNAALQEQVKGLVEARERKTFPILNGGGARIDYHLVSDHAEQAQSNHGQSVDRLAKRGGLSWCELYAVLHNRKWEKIDTNDAMIACRGLEARYLAAVQAKEGGK